MWFGSLDQATGGWIGYKNSKNCTEGQGFYNITGSQPSLVLNITKCGVGLKNIDGAGITDLSVAVYNADPADAQKWVYPSLAHGNAGAIGGVGAGWINISMTTTGQIYSNKHYFLVFYEGGALNGGLELKLTNTGGGGDLIYTSNGTYGHNIAYNVSSFITFNWTSIPINNTITTPENTTYTGIELTTNASFNSNATANCTRYLNGAIWNSTIESNSIPYYDQLTGLLVGNNNYTVNCTNETNGQTSQDTVYFTIDDTFSFRAYDNVSSTQLQNFTVTFANATNTTAYTATGEWLNVSRSGLPFGDINLTIQLDGYETTTFQRNVNNTEIIYENYPISPAGFNIFTFDEETNERIYFTASIYNSTVSLTWNTVHNITEYYLNSSFPTGVCTVDISTANNSHYARRYYATITNESYYWLDAHLLNQSTDAVLVRFHIQTINGAPIEDALMNILVQDGAGWIVVGQDYSDASGTVMFYMALNQPYTIQVTHGDYQSYSTILNPSSTDYYITLTTIGAGAVYNPITVVDDISYALFPDPRVISEELTNISFYVVSSNSTIQYFGMEVIWNGTSEFIHNVTGSPAGGIVSYVFNWSNVTGIIPPITRKTGGLLVVHGWIKRNPDLPLWWNFHEYVYNSTINSLHSAVEGLTTSGTSSVFMAILVFLVALFMGAWVARRNRNAGLITILVILGIGTSFGWMAVSSPWGAGSNIPAILMIGVAALVAWLMRDKG